MWAAVSGLRKKLTNAWPVALSFSIGSRQNFQPLGLKHF